MIKPAHLQLEVRRVQGGDKYLLFKARIHFDKGQVSVSVFYFFLMTFFLANNSLVIFFSFE
ncbi:hypothetical protein DZJ_23630 [Dickeya ananatis]